MKTKDLNNKARKALRGRCGGFTLIEVLVALALFSIIGIVFAGGLGTASKASFIGDVRTTAESLARSQMEYIRTSDYDDQNDPPEYSVNPDIDIPDGYTIDIEAVRLDPEEDGEEDDDGLQKITVVVSHEGEEVITLEGYKVNPERET